MPYRDRSFERRRVKLAADDYGGVLSRDLLAAGGIDDAMIRREVRAGRWQVHGRQTVAMHTGPLGPEAYRWRAVWEIGSRIAVLDGVSALQASGLTGFDDDLVHVSVPHTATLHKVGGVKVHKLARRLDLETYPGAGVPRTPVAIASIRAAHWAVSDRQAALILVMPIQQRLCSPAQLRQARQQVRGRNRRALIDRLVLDVCDGAHSLGELDFARLCRSFGLPEPDRQVVRQTALGRVYLDVRWRGVPLIVEIDGAGHRAGLQVTSDNLRANELVIAAERVLRIDLVGLRVALAQFMDQVCRAYRAALLGSAA